MSNCAVLPLESETRVDTPPGAAIAIGLPALAACVAFCLITAWLPSETGGVHVGLMAGGLAAICATFAGIPTAYWAFSTGRRKLVQWMALGAAAGAVPTLVVLAGGALGALLRGEPGILRVGPAC